MSVYGDAVAHSGVWPIPPGWGCAASSIPLSRAPAPPAHSCCSGSAAHGIVLAANTLCFCEFIQKIRGRYF